jgi:hypothetical protein
MRLASIIYDFDFIKRKLVLIFNKFIAYYSIIILVTPERTKLILEGISVQCLKSSSIKKHIKKVYKNISLLNKASSCLFNNLVLYEAESRLSRMRFVQIQTHT